MPMMATPVAIALVWTMMFHPQQGVLNYLLSLVGLPPSLWVYSPQLVIPSLVLVEIWHWTPLVMLIVLGVLTKSAQFPFHFWLPQAMAAPTPAKAWAAMKAGAEARPTELRFYGSDRDAG